MLDLIWVKLHYARSLITLVCGLNLKPGPDPIYSFGDRLHTRLIRGVIKRCNLAPNRAVEASTQRSAILPFLLTFL